MTAYDSIQELRDLYASLEARVAKLEAVLKASQPSQAQPQPQYSPPTQEEIINAEYGGPSWQPSEKQLNFARDIAKTLNHTIDWPSMTKHDVSAYISRYRQEFYKRLEEKRRLERDAAKMKPLEVGGARA